MLSVLVPVRNGDATLRSCLEALLWGDRSPDELIVVDDRSSDGSRELAEEVGARLVRREGADGGAAHVRNLGARTAEGDILIFVDADVVVHADTLALIEAEFSADPELAALFGSYDDDPPGGVVSRYKNLEHHFVHQHARRDTSNFWTGCGAVRRSVFLSVGGFDERYLGASIEDIDLGWRMRRAGYRIRLCPEVQGTHLKRWTLWQMVRADILGRAVPWTRLIVRESFLPADLNLDYRSRASAVIAWAGLFALVVGAWVHAAWIVGALCLVGLGALNAPLYGFLRRRGGWGFAVAGFAMHTLYFLYSSATFVIVNVLTRLRDRRAPARRTG
jgi:GT2 family glycosyltransferase